MQLKGEGSTALRENVTLCLYIRTQPISTDEILSANMKMIFALLKIKCITERERMSDPSRISLIFDKE
jgi:hypothetical protein